MEFLHVFMNVAKKKIARHSDNFSGTLTKPFKTSYTSRCNIYKISQLSYGWTDLSIL